MLAVFSPKQPSLTRRRCYSAPVPRLLEQLVGVSLVVAASRAANPPRANRPATGGNGFLARWGGVDQGSRTRTRSPTQDGRDPRNALLTVPPDRLREVVVSHRRSASRNRGGAPTARLRSPAQTGIRLAARHVMSVRRRHYRSISAAVVPPTVRATERRGTSLAVRSSQSRNWGPAAGVPKLTSGPLLQCGHRSECPLASGGERNMRLDRVRRIGEALWSGCRLGSWNGLRSCWLRTRRSGGCVRRCRGRGMRFIGR